jgi:hypothetical protein
MPTVDLITIDRRDDGCGRDLVVHVPETVAIRTNNKPNRGSQKKLIIII